jgi:hypothetical protein
MRDPTASPLAEPSDSGREAPSADTTFSLGGYLSTFRRIAAVEMDSPSRVRLRAECNPVFGLNGYDDDSRHRDSPLAQEQ